MSLKGLINSISLDVLNNGLNNFRNTKDKDIEDFLRNKTITYENRHWCSTYLLVNSELFTQKNVIKIEGYFTLSNKVIRIADTISKTRKKKLFNGMVKDHNYLHTILIGQLGKHIDESKTEPEYGNTSMFELLDLAFEIIESVNECIVCRCVLVECRESSEFDSEKICQNRYHLHEKYRDYGFVALQTEDSLVQYIITL